MKTEADFLNAVIRANTAAWFEVFGRVWAKDRSKGVIKPRVNYLQRKIQRVMDKFEEDSLPVRIIELKPRARGSTTYCTAIGYTKMRRTSTSAVFIGGQSDQTVGLWNMMKTYHSNDRFDWGNTGTVNEKGASFTNGSRAKKETAKDVQAGIGDTYNLLHATEVARWGQYGVANAPDVMANILKAVPLLPGTVVLLESTAEGSGNDFHVRWLDAVDAEDFLSGAVELQPGQYVRVFAAFFEFTDSALRLTDAQKREIQATIDGDPEYDGEKFLIETYGRDDNGVMRLGTSVTDCDVWEQLAWRRYCIRTECKRDKAIFDRDYPHSWQSAFQQSGRARFNQTGLQVMRGRLKDRTPEHGLIEETKERRLSWRRTDQGEAKFTIFDKPQVGCRYILAIDPMTGASQTSGADPDRHGVFVLKAGRYDNMGAWHRPSTAARIVPCRWDIDVLEDQVWRLARFYGSTSGCIIVIEVNQDRGLIELLKLRGANFYLREIENRLEYKTTTAIGYQTNVKTRERLIDTMAGAIREWNTPGEGIDIWCSHALEQCENFVTKSNGRSEAGDGFKDDDVFSIALGLQVIEHATTYQPQNFQYLPPDLQQLQRPGGMAPSAFS